MELWLCRHGETANRERARFGDLPLCAAGRAQARGLGRELARVPFDRVLSSPMERARETAGIAVSGRGLAVETHSCLEEAALGELAGVPYEEARTRWPEDFALGLTAVARMAASGRTAPGGESRGEFLERVDAARQLLLPGLRDPSARWLVFSHGGLLNYLLQRLVGMPVRDEVPFGFANCGWVRVVHYSESPDFGPFPMLVFGPASGAAL